MLTFYNRKGDLIRDSNYNEPNLPTYTSAEESIDETSSTKANEEPVVLTDEEEQVIEEPEEPTL